MSKKRVNKLILSLLGIVYSIHKDITGKYPFEKELEGAGGKT